MSNEDLSWITARITKTKESHPLVTEAVSSRISQLLETTLSERQLTSTEFTSVATTLLDDMAASASDSKTKL